MAHAWAQPTFVSRVMAASWPQAGNVSLLVHPTHSPLPEHVQPATQIARPVLGRRLTSVQIAHLADRYSRMADASRRAPRHNSSTMRVEAVKCAIAAVRVALVPAQVIALHAQPRPQFFAGDLAWQPTAAGMGRLLSPALGCVFRISSPFRRCQGHRFPSHFLQSLESTRRP